MTLKRSAAKRDKNEREIIELAEQLGYSVRQLSDKGIPDLLLGIQHRQSGKYINLLAEIKDGPRRALTGEQAEFFATWNGQCVVLHTIDEAEEYLKSAMGYYSQTT